ncbi:hypothetical protein IAD21_01437 [Abditibacteriota bacterium]|nr:hypothetical protein IAD21_01437 [Abditibacteriota bacterium]
MIHPKHTDEPAICPATPAAALWRLERLEGALAQEEEWDAMPILQENLAQARKGLQEAAKTQPDVGAAFQNAQMVIRSIYDAAVSDPPLAVRLGFPDPDNKVKDFVAPVDLATVVTTHFKPQKQIFTTISFEEAHGATAYWLFEIRSLANAPKGEDEALDAILENYAPCFSRVRLPVGKHRLVIESRNPSKSTRTQEFEIEVPAL